MINRAAIRTTFADLLTAALVGEDLPAQAVYAYQVGDFAGQSPVITVSSAGSGHGPLTFGGSSARVQIDVHCFVRYADPASGWTEQDAEDTLDAIATEIAALVAARQRSAHWQAIDYRGDSEADFLPIGGVEYKHERIPLTFHCF